MPTRALVRSLTSLALFSTLIIACSDGGGGSSGGETLKDLGIDDGASAGIKTSKLVKAGEETTLTLKTGAQVVIPGDALEKDTVIGMTRPEDRVASSLVKTVQANLKVASAPYVLTPHGSKFKSDVELTLPIAKSSDRRIAVAWLEDEEDTSWEVIEPAPAVNGKSATMKVAHFSVLLLVEVSDAVDGTAMDSGTGEVRIDADTPVTSEPDGDVVTPSDATLPDATLPDASLTYQQRLVARFTECSLQSSAGMFADFMPDTAQELCQMQCALSASCADFESDWCPLTEASIAYTNCMELCDGFRRRSCLNVAGAPITARDCDQVVECNGGVDETSCMTSDWFLCGTQTIPAPRVCDGIEQCSNGQDEANCPGVRYFTCSNGRRIPSEGRCDGQRACGDGSDEVGCTYFNCADGLSTVPMQSVCNVNRDCRDGSDEPATCLHLTCVDTAALID